MIRRLLASVLGDTATKHIAGEMVLRHHRGDQTSDGIFDSYGHQNGTSFAANLTCSEER